MNAKQMSVTKLQILSVRNFGSPFIPVRIQKEVVSFLEYWNIVPLNYLRLDYFENRVAMIQAKLHEI